VKGFSHWVITLRQDIFWSDGRPISQEDVIQTFYSRRLASIISEVRPNGKRQLHVLLSKEEPIFPLYGQILIRPAHSTKPYQVTSGAYRLKNFNPKAQVFRLERHRDYYRDNHIGIDLITLKLFERYSNVVKAALSQKIDFLALRSLQHLYQVSKAASPQQCPFVRGCYYLLFLNRRRGLLADKSNCHLLSELIDYRAINRYLHAGQIQEEAEEEVKPSPRHSLDLKIACFEDPDSSYLAYLVGKSVGASVVNPIFIKEEKDDWKKMRKNADAFLTQIYFGFKYSRLSGFFHSNGGLNPFFYSKPQVDKLLSVLDKTAHIAQREIIGQQVLTLLQDDFAVILLSPCFEYVLSPLEIQFDNKLVRHADFAHNMSRLVVQRDRPRG
jgi:ABC-type transport system substrate-binding protein